MTIEELSVRITAEADEALEMLDLITQRLTALESLLGQTLHIGLDAEAAVGSMTLLDEQLTALQERLGQQTQELTQAVEGVLGSLTEGLGGLRDGLENTGGIQHAMAETAEAVDRVADAAGDAAGELLDLERSQQDANRQAQSYRSTLQELDTRLERLGRQRQAVSSMRDLSQQFSQSSQNAGRMQNALRNAERGIISGIRAADDMSDSFREMGNHFDHTGDTVTVNAQRLYGQLGGVIAWANNAADSLQIDGSVQVDTSGAVAALNNLIQVALAAQSILAGLGVASGGAGSAAGVKVGGGGGGGGSKKRSAEEEAAARARAEEEARKDALRLDYEQLEHKRHMNEITLEEEIQLLNKIRRRHQMNAEEIMEWEERIYDVKQEIRQRDAEQLDRLSQGVVEALTEKYEAMRDAELERVEESRRAWETWRDDSVRAIDDQIAALDRLAAAEQREDQDAEELRRIEKLKRDIAYEQDEFNRKKLEEQLANAIADREKRLRRQELEDQKAALRQQAEEVERTAQQELDQLDEEEAAIEKLYEQRLETAALEAEAEKLIMENSQKEILELLKTYVPEYDLLGRSMGERMMDGFKNAVGGVVDWFHNLSGQMDSAWNQLVSTAGRDVSLMTAQPGSATASRPEVNITQNVNFNQPVESPGDVARRMESVNQALGEWMSQEG